MRRTSLPFLKINSLINTTPVQKLIAFRNIHFSDIVNTTQVDLISTDGISSTQDILFEFTNITFTGVSYSMSGYLMDLNHLLVNQVLIQNSSFTNLTNAGIRIGGTASNSNVIKSKVKIINSVFNSSMVGTSSFISTYTKSEVEIINCTFTNMATVDNGAVLRAMSSEVIVNISDSLFQNNSAIEGSLFNIESKGVVRCTNCTIINNFAVTSGIARTDSSGYFEFYSSTITQNFAVNYIISVLFDSVNLSVIDSSEIYENKPMTLSEVINEINNECVNLCFLPDKIKEVVLESQTYYAEQGETPTLFQLVQASLMITNASKIHSEDRLINSFLSILIFENSILYDMAIKDTSIETIQSTLEFNDMTVYNITNVQNKPFILANLDSDFKISNVQYSDSN